MIGKPDDEAGELPIAFIIAADPELTEQGVYNYMSEMLASYKQLHQVNFVTEIPKSPSGKILRRLLRDQIANR